MPAEAAGGWPSAMLAFQVLHSSFVNRACYHARVAPLGPSGAAERIDECLWEAAAAVCGLPELDPDHEKRALGELPIAAGGLGVGGFRVLAPGCYLAGWLDALPSLAARAGLEVEELVVAIDEGASAAAPFFREAIDAAAEVGCTGCRAGGQLRLIFAAFADHLATLGEDQKSPFVRPDGSRRWQAFVNEPVKKARAKAWTEAASSELQHVQKLTSQPGAGPGSWLLARVLMPELLPTNDEFRAAMRLRLRLPVAPDVQGRQCQHVSLKRERCTGRLDDLGDHAVNCSVGGFHVQRHNETATALEAALKVAGFSGVATEVLVPEWEREHPTRPGERQAAVLDVSLVCKGQTEYVDINVYHGFAGNGEIAKRWRAEDHEREKDGRYKPWGPRASPHTLVPFVFNVYGGAGPRGRGALKRWAAASKGKLRADCLPLLSLTVARRVGAQVVAAFTGRGQRTALNGKEARSGAEAVASLEP